MQRGSTRRNHMRSSWIVSQLDQLSGYRHILAGFGKTAISGVPV
jgi:hypothetical protein